MCNMSKRSIIILACVATAVVVATGLGVLIWWLVTRGNNFTVIRLEGEGIGDLPYTAAFTRIHDAGDMFWWFYPTLAADDRGTQPIILWLDGVTGVPPSLLANLGMIGPYDINFNKRENSWIDKYNLLFIDAPLGTGFSTPLNKTLIPRNIDENAEHLAITLQSFYSVHKAYRNAPLYIFGQAHGAQLATALAIKITEVHPTFNLRGVVMGNGIISPALVMTKLGFYLEELAYIDANGRNTIETLSNSTMTLVTMGEFGAAFEMFSNLSQFVNENAGAVAVNLGYIVEKLTRESLRDNFSPQKNFNSNTHNAVFDVMNTLVARALGVPSNINYDSGRQDVIDAFRDTFMVPATDKVEYILQNTQLSVSIYNGNLDAISNTPGQLEWVDNLQWAGQAEFRASPRETLVINRLVEGYFRETRRLKFYWINAAGLSAPYDSPTAMNTILPRILVN